VFVLPSVGPGETWGLALNEAMASGRPVIASSRVGGARDLVRPDGTGWVFEAGDVAGLAATLAGALGEGRAGLLARGRAAAAASAAFSSAATARGIADAVVGRLAGGRG
jgi:glycosyltransferase involved in cell wall biosynthesis